MGRKKQVWQAKGVWYVTTWWERDHFNGQEGRKRRFLKTRPATTDEIAS